MAGFKQVFEQLSEETGTGSQDLYNLVSGLSCNERCNGGLQTCSITQLDPQLDQAFRQYEEGSRSVYLLEELANGLTQRYEILGAVSDIESAIQFARQALRLDNDDPSGQSRRLVSLGNSLRLRHFRRQVTENPHAAMIDLDEAVRLQTDAVHLASDDHSSYLAFYRNNLSKSLADKAIATRTIANTGWHSGDREERQQLRKEWARQLEHAIQLSRQVYDTTSDAHPLRGMFLHDLGWQLFQFYESRGSGHDLEEAIELMRQAAEVTAHDNPSRSSFLNNLGRVLYSSFTKTRDEDHYLESMRCFYWALTCESSSPFIRIAAGISFMHFSANKTLAYEAASIAVGLIPRLTSPLLGSSDKQHALGRIFSLASDGAALALEAGVEPYAALSLIEQGRGAFAKSLEDIRVDITELRNRHPEVAERVAHLRSQLEVSPTTAQASPDSKYGYREVQQRYHLSKAFDELIDEIRELPGFERFLDSPNEEEIRAAARWGPLVVINLSRYRCDAILVEQHRIRTVRLPNIDENELYTKLEDDSVGRSHTLKWLWDNITCPILNALGLVDKPPDNDWPRIWWIPMGALSMFPLHAAGNHENGSSETVLDRVMSTYSPSIKAIIYARQRPVQPLSLSNVLLVAMEHTPQNRSLPFAAREVAALRNKCISMSLNPIEPARRKDSVMSHLKTCSIFHFAGHGYTDQDDPSNSHLRLDDWENDPLRVSDLLELNLHQSPPFLAYLSACGTGQVEEGRFMTESIHLISGCQIAGFRHVVGTLWKVNDSLCVDMAEIMYEGLRQGGMSDRSVCYGLHSATRELRDRWLRDGQQTSYATKSVSETSKLGGEADRRSENRSRVSRDMVDDDSDDGSERPAVTPQWVPYVHFGV